MTAVVPRMGTVAVPSPLWLRMAKVTSVRPWAALSATVTSIPEVVMKSSRDLVESWTSLAWTVITCPPPRLSSVMFPCEVPCAPDA